MRQVMIFIALKLVELAGVCGLLYGVIWLGYFVETLRDPAIYGYCAKPFEFPEASLRYFGIGVFTSILLFMVGFILWQFVKFNWLLAGKLCILFALLLFACPAWAGSSIFDREYTKYPREVYEKFCDHYLTAGGVWYCMDVLDRNGIPEMGCEKPVYLWAKEGDREKMLYEGWKKAPLNSYENVGNPPYAPRVFWFYRCPD